jgi:hypothetical protein
LKRTEKNDTAIEELNQHLSSTDIGIAIVVLITNVLLIVFGVRLYRQIIIPISEMQEATSYIASTQDFTLSASLHQSHLLGRSKT